MKRQDITKDIARQTRTSTARAADEVDRVVSDMIRKLRRGEKPDLPGLGPISAALRQRKEPRE